MILTFTYCICIQVASFQKKNFQLDLLVRHLLDSFIGVKVNTPPNCTKNRLLIWLFRRETIENINACITLGFAAVVVTSRCGGMTNFQKCPHLHKLHAAACTQMHYFIKQQIERTAV